MAKSLRKKHDTISPDCKKLELKMNKMISELEKKYAEFNLCIFVKHEITKDADAKLTLFGLSVSRATTSV